MPADINKLGVQVWRAICDKCRVDCHVTWKRFAKWAPLILGGVRTRLGEYQSLFIECPRCHSRADMVRYVDMDGTRHNVRLDISEGFTFSEDAHG